MKGYSLFTALLSAAASTSAFCPQQQKVFGKTSLQAKAKSSWSSVATIVVGWTLASQISTMPIAAGAHDILSSSSLIAVMPMKSPEPIRETLDFSLPTYDSKATGGFGDGVEAYLGKSMSDSSIGSGSTEAQRQVEAMRKAEVARKARLVAQKEVTKQREAEEKIRAAERKKENDARTRALFE